MDTDEILKNRMANQLILRGKTSAKPEDVVATLGAMQAQDYQAALWAIGMRCGNGTTKSDVEQAISDRKITRTWLMRGTLHIASSKDIRWMLGLFGPRLRTTAIKRDANLGLSQQAIRAAEQSFYKALRGNKTLQRKEMYEIMGKARIPASNNLGYHLLYRAAWDGLIVFGPQKGSQQTFTLLDEWVPDTKPLSADESIIELTMRYFSSHGPATIKDYVWWSGLTVHGASLGIEKCGSRLKQENINNKTYYMPKKARRAEGSDSTYLLPAFDEYIISYSDRSAMLDNVGTQKRLKSGKIAFAHSNGVFLPTIISDGKVIGTWKRSNSKNGIIIKTNPFVRLSNKQKSDINGAADNYGRFFESDAFIKQ